MKQASTVEEYLEGVPAKDRAALERVRKIIKATAPKATEAVSYGVIMFKTERQLGGFGAFQDHLSLFIGPEVIEAHRKELENYKTSKGTIHFHADKPLPAALVKKLIKTRLDDIARSLEKGAKKRPGKKPK